MKAKTKTTAAVKRKYPLLTEHSIFKCLLKDGIKNINLSVKRGLNALHTHTHTHTHTKTIDPCHPVQADMSPKYSLQYFCMLKYSTTDYFQYYHYLHNPDL